MQTTPQSMNSTGSFETLVTSLSGLTTYYFRAKAVGDGPAMAEKSFMTWVRRPSSDTDNATSITSDSAR